MCVKLCASTISSRVQWIVNSDVDATDHCFGSNSPIADCSGAHRSGTPFLHAFSVLIPTYHATLSAYPLALSIRCRKRCGRCSTLCVIKGGTRTYTIPERRKTLIRNKENYTVQKDRWCRRQCGKAEFENRHPNSHEFYGDSKLSSGSHAFPGIGDSNDKVVANVNACSSADKQDESRGQQAC